MALETYVPIVIFPLIAFLFPLGTFFATRLFRPDHPTPLKDLTYECGELPEGVAQIQFHFQYYMFALIFVIFDVAAIFLLLWAFAWGGLLNSASPVAKFSIFLFLGIMFVATQYALKKKEVLAQLKVAFGPKLKDAKVVRERLVEIVIDRAELVPVCTYLKDTLGFEHLSCVTAVDWKDHFESIYHIENYYNGCMVQVNAQIPYDDPKIATLTGLWHAADFLEREMWDLMGVEYTGHPNLTRILLPEDFKFHPLRKEFAQEVDRQYITRRKLRGGK